MNCINCDHAQEAHLSEGCQYRLPEFDAHGHKAMCGCMNFRSDRNEEYLARIAVALERIAVSLEEADLECVGGSIAAIADALIDEQEEGEE